MTKITKGKQGEEIAVKYLKEKGYVILERNFRYSRMGEIDIIAKKNFTVCAIEVKTRTSNLFGRPIDSITRTKLAKIYKTFKYYLQNTKYFYFRNRIDVISVYLDKYDYNIYKTEHLKNIEIQ